MAKAAHKNALVSRKRRSEKAARQHRRAQRAVQRKLSLSSPTVVWEGVVFSSGGYQTASRFLLQGLIEAGTDVEVRPFWTTGEVRRLDGD
jgi:hypothetical protein